MKNILEFTRKSNLKKSSKLYSSFNLLLSIFCLIILLPSCQEDDEVVDCDTYQWEYEGEGTPDTWPLCNAECGGQAQSPINIAGAVPDNNLKAFTTAYKAVPIGLVNNGHSIQFDYDEGSTINVNGEEFELLQFHFHTLSEHTVGDQHFPIEAHLVHQNTAGALAVVSVLFEEGSENTFLSNFAGNLPDSEGKTYSSADMVNIQDILPADDGYYTYSGSLTTPPCSEIATWVVMKSPVEASSNQIQEMSDILNDNFRPVQALNGREIKEFN